MKRSLIGSCLIESEMVGRMAGSHANQFKGNPESQR